MSSNVTEMWNPPGLNKMLQPQAVRSKAGLTFPPHLCKYLWNQIRYRKVTSTKWKILLAAFKWRALCPSTYHSFDAIPSEKRCYDFAEHRKIFFRRNIIDIIKGTWTQSTPFESCKQDLLFRGCNFSVAYLVSEILAQTWPKCYSHFGLTPPFRPSFLSHSDHVWPDISGTS